MNQQLIFFNAIFLDNNKQLSHHHIFSYFFVGLAAFFLDGLNASPQVVLLSRLGNDNIVSFLLDLLFFFFFLLCPRIGPSDGFGFLAFLVGELFYGVEVFLEVDFPSIFEFFLGIQ